MDSFELSTDTYNPSELRRENRRRPLQPVDPDRLPLEDVDAPRRPLVPDETDTRSEMSSEETPVNRRRAASTRAAGKTKVPTQNKVTAASSATNNHSTEAEPVRPEIGAPEEKAASPTITIPNIPVRKLFADERISIFFGVVLILFTAYLLVASISYIANQGADQSALLNSSADIIKGRAADIKNTTGWVGAFLSHFLIYKSLGLGSFILMFFTGALGLHLVGLCRIRFWSFTFKCLVSAIAVSLIAGLLTFQSASPTFWGGEHGFYINQLLIDNASLWSAVALGVAMLTALVLIFLKPLAFVCGKAGASFSRLRSHWAERHNAAIEAAHRTEVRKQAERAAAMARANREQEQQAAREAKAAAQAAEAQTVAETVSDNPDEVINIAAVSKPQQRAAEAVATEPKPVEIPQPTASDEEPMPKPAEKPAPLDELFTPLAPNDLSGLSEPVAAAATVSAELPTSESKTLPSPSPLALATEATQPSISLDVENTQPSEELTPQQYTDDSHQNDLEPLADPLAVATVEEEAPASAPVTPNNEDTPTPVTLPPMTVTLAPEAEAAISLDEVSEESTSDSITKTEPANYDPHADLSHYHFPSIDLLREIADDGPTVDEEEQEANKVRITNILLSYGVEIASISATIGPTITLYEIVPAPGVRISKIKRLGDDVALSLAAMGIRIIAPMPGKGTIGMEVPNKKARTVSMRSILNSRAYRESKAQLPMALGNTISNDVYVTDLAKMPHLLVAGATGMGKSVGLNTIIASLLYSKHPSELKFVLVDPKMVEFSLYRSIEKHYLAKLPEEENAIITQPENVVATLNSLCKEMDDRYQLLSDAGVRGLVEYNEKFVQRKLNPEKGHRFLPYIVVIIDEFADLILTVGKEVETPISRLAAKARAIGIHVILATQRPSVNVITGVIKANFPSRMAFRVTQRNDSQTIIDRPGAEQLIGRGDMLISRNGIIDRVQCAFIDTPEVEAICQHIASQQSYPSAYELPEMATSSEVSASGSLTDRDPLFAEAGREVIAQGIGSTSSLQRKFNIGYPRAGKIMDQLEMAGVVGPTQGGKPRAVLVDMYSFERFLEN